MADLNKELNEYLLSNKNEKQYKIAMPSVGIPKLGLGKWFGRSLEEDREESGWLKDASKECCPSMTRLQRLTAFGICFVMGILCFCLSTIYIPVLLLKARKFALLYSIGSLFFLMSFAFLWGPLTYLTSLFSVERRCFSITYIATLTGTLYFALHLQSTSLTVLCAVLQIIAMLSFLISHIPGGTTGLMFFTRMFKSSVSSTLSV
ncbi:PREDICTED: protein transport protein SFT2 [Ceratosolen solmsi marchali]|uniref:Vesicle transport protein n=1 Tax=Ceratosolen solmsi marchali TaxID=326594 RepID=A0AAJ6YX64_9HYME|nr:PREDICTED: protein transport protein SFT2 [Ceratosolen solmsi marchali]